MPLSRYRIYHREQEYAQSLGDPVITVLIAGSPEEAEQRAELEYYMPTGAIAVAATDFCLPDEFMITPEELEAAFKQFNHDGLVNVNYANDPILVSVMGRYTNCDPKVSSGCETGIKLGMLISAARARKLLDTFRKSFPRVEEFKVLGPPGVVGPCEDNCQSSEPQSARVQASKKGD